MINITEACYNDVDPDRRSVWSNSEYPEYVGKRTLMLMHRGETCLVVEGTSLLILKNPLPLLFVDKGTGVLVNNSNRGWGHWGPGADDLCQHGKIRAREVPLPVRMVNACPDCGATTEKEAETVCHGRDGCPMTSCDDWQESLERLNEEALQVQEWERTMAEESREITVSREMAMDAGDLSLEGTKW